MECTEYMVHNANRAYNHHILHTYQLRSQFSPEGSSIHGMHGIHGAQRKQGLQSSHPSHLPTPITILARRIVYTWNARNTWCTTQTGLTIITSFTLANSDHNSRQKDRLYMECTEYMVHNANRAYNHHILHTCQLRS